MTDEILRLPKVLATTGMSRSWTYRAISEGRFPAPVALGTRAVGWKRSEIDAWLASRARKEG